jgi:hypothetical protein
MPFLLTEKPAKAFGFVVFSSGKEAEQITVSDGAKGFCAIAVVAEAAGGEDWRRELTVFGFQPFERGEGDAVSAVDVVEGFQEFGFALMVRELGLRGWIGACSFTNSHHLPPC